MIDTTRTCDRCGQQLPLDRDATNTSVLYVRAKHPSSERRIIDLCDRCSDYLLVKVAPVPPSPRDSGKVTTEARDEAMAALGALRLEVPGEVWSDVTRKVGAALDALVAERCSECGEVGAHRGTCSRSLMRCGGALLGGRTIEETRALLRTIPDPFDRNSAYAVLDALVAEREALAARLAEAERQRDNLEAALRSEMRFGESLRARVAALTEALRPLTRWDFYACQYIVGLEHDGHALVGLHVEDRDAIIEQIQFARKVLAAADRPEGTTP